MTIGERVRETIRGSETRTFNLWYILCLLLHRRDESFDFCNELNNGVLVFLSLPGSGLHKSTVTLTVAAAVSTRDPITSLI